MFPDFQTAIKVKIQVVEAIKNVELAQKYSEEFPFLRRGETEIGQFAEVIDHTNRDETQTSWKLLLSISSVTKTGIAQ